MSGEDQAASRSFVLERLRRRDESTRVAEERRSKLCPILRPMKDRWPS